jgi:hypothetical protein
MSYPSRPLAALIHIVPIKGLHDTVEVNQRTQDYRDMEDLMRGTPDIEFPGSPGLGKVILACISVRASNAGPLVVEELRCLLHKTQRRSISENHPNSSSVTQLVYQAARRERY